MKLHLRAPLLAILCLALPGLALADDLMNDKVQGNGDKGPGTIYLGSVAVGGQRNVYEALQDIKVALEQPLSDDPKLANVVVCRITDDIGSHTKQLLVCGTNKVLTQDKEILQTVMSSSLADQNASLGGDKHGGSPTGCLSAACYENSISILNESLDVQHRHYFKQQVNAASLHALLTTIPYPKQVQAVPASSTVPAPAVVTSHV